MVVWGEIRERESRVGMLGERTKHFPVCGRMGPVFIHNSMRLQKYFEDLNYFLKNIKLDKNKHWNVYIKYKKIYTLFRPIVRNRL